MTREEAKQLLPIIQAFAEGKTIQVKVTDNRWYAINLATFAIFKLSFCTAHIFGFNRL